VTLSCSWGNSSRQRPALGVSGFSATSALTPGRALLLRTLAGLTTGSGPGHRP
jgi:hypothetical protein